MSRSATETIAFDATLVRAERVTGIERVILELLRALGQVLPPTQDVLVLARPEGVQKLPPLPSSFELLVSPVNNRVFTDQVWLPAMLARRKPGVVHHPALAPGFLTPRPFVLTLHDLAHHRAPEQMSVGGRWYYRPMMEAAVRSGRLRGLITGSETAADEIARAYPIARNNIVVASHALPHGFARATASRQHEVLARHGITRPFILTVGTQSPAKNLAAVVSAFGMLHEQGAVDAQLIMVGRHGWGDAVPVPPAAKAKIRSLGYVPDEDLLALYSAASIFAFPSFYEGFGLPLLEAMECGAACLAADIPVLREVGSDACLFADPHRPADFADKLRLLLTDETLRLNMVEKGHARVAAYSWDRNARIHQRMYDDILNGAAPDLRATA